jgi:pyruvate dehydrogenase (quinone)
MVLEGNPEFGVELQPIDFAAYARACGAADYTITEPAIIEAVVDATEPPLPGHVTTKQAYNFAMALARGQEDRWDILKTVAENTVREVI